MCVCVCVCTTAKMSEREKALWYAACVCVCVFGCDKNRNKKMCVSTLCQCLSHTYEDILYCLLKVLPADSLTGLCLTLLLSAGSGCVLTSLTPDSCADQSDP